MACKSLCKQWKAMHTDMAGWRYFLRGSWLSIFFGIHPPGASKYVMSKHCVKRRPPSHLSLRSDVTSHPGWWFSFFVFFYLVQAGYVSKVRYTMVIKYMCTGDHRHICRSDQRSHHTLVGFISCWSFFL